MLDVAASEGWDLGGPGLTFTVQFVKPSDPLALPVYASWTVGRADSGKLSFRFQSSGTSGLHPLNSKDLIAYLEDPTVVYPDAHSDEAGMKISDLHTATEVHERSMRDSPEYRAEYERLAESDAKALEPQGQPTIPTPVLKPAQSRSGLRVTIPRV
jgi:hypothetical protein